VSGNLPFGFTPGDGDDDRDSGFDMSQLGAMLQQLGAMLQSSMSGSQSSGPVNWELANDTARRALVSAGDPSVTDGQRSASETAVDLAEVWLDGTTQFPATGGRPAAWSRSEWLQATLSSWQGIIDPIAERVQGSMSALLPGEGALPNIPGMPEGMPAELGDMLGPLMGMAKQMGASMFAMQAAQGLAGLAGEVLCSSDVGIPLTEDGRPALLPNNIKTFGEGLGVPERDMVLFVALRECAHQRLFAHVPWLRSRLQSAVDAYARGITVDSDRIEQALSGIDPTNPAGIQEVLASGVFVGEDSPEQRNALASLETLLALVEGWVQVVVAEAAATRLDSFTGLQEAIVRRRGAGGPAERTFATLVGLEMRPRKLREAVGLWQALGEARGQAGRDALWAHPDLLPTPEDLERPGEFIAATDPELVADLESALAALTSGEFDSEGNDAGEPQEQGDDAATTGASEQSSRDEASGNAESDNHGEDEEKGPNA
jgi:putative hydrolase